MPAIAVASVVGVLVTNRLVSESIATQLSAFNGIGTQVVFDEIAAADIAAGAAELSGLIVADEAIEYADAVAGTSAVAGISDKQSIKPNIVKTDIKTRQDIVQYTVKSGQSLSDIANQFNVTTDTIKWANDLTSENINAGKKLTILPISGVLHTVDQSDTFQSLAKKYKANAQQIMAFNDLEISGLKEGMKIVVPEGTKPTPVVRRSFLSSYRFFNVNSTYLGRYTKFGLRSGWCTDWSYHRSAQLGNALPRNLGNAHQWNDRLSQSRVHPVRSGGQPIVGAVAQRNNHVVVVEEVSADRTMIKYSDMNGLEGWGNAGVTNDWVPASGFEYYLY